ncbi:MAG: YgiQ family radical SAM protein [Oscillospiraceae bacterium]|nr:YgiQ family radical SAM protein [Oscillospiraceae bacterium]
MKDFICITGDVYADHPSFGIAIVVRLLESMGLSVGVISQPVKESEFAQFGLPRFGFLVTGGNIDSMVANYTVAGKPRRDGNAGNRPDYAVNSYCKALGRLFPGCGIIIGGLEASLRRFAHYDYWSDSVLPSVLVSSGADLLVYGMAELALRELAERLRGGENLRNITDLRGTCYVAQTAPGNALMLDSFEQVREDKRAYMKAAVIQHEEHDEVRGKTLAQAHAQAHGEAVVLVQNPPQRSLSESEMDAVYELPFSRKLPQGLPACFEEVEFSLIWTRGCFGACNFCSLAFHQGRRVQTRSEESLIKEAREFTQSPRFKGYIHDVGGPTANFSQPSCAKQIKSGFCRNRKCLSPTSCKSLRVSHEKFLGILRKLREIPKVKRVFVRSGVRYDYAMLDPKQDFLRELAAFHVSGQLKVAPEHCKARVLELMGKPPISVYERFSEEFARLSSKAGKQQYLVPYLMSSHPGATLDDALDLAIWLKARGIRPQQVQDFYPTPGTLSTAMYYTGLAPYTLEKIYVAKSDYQKATQRALLQYYKPENAALFAELLNKRKSNANVKKSKQEIKKGAWKPRPDRDNSNRNNRRGNRR